MTSRPLITCLAASVFAVSLPFATFAQTAAPSPQTQAKKNAKQPAKPKDEPQPAQNAAGAAPALIAQYGDWGVYVSQAPKTKICYALSQPKDRQPAGLK